MSTRKVNDPDSGYMVVIRFIGETTTATLMHGDREVKTSEAKCSPADKFQYGEGAKIAVDRLFEKKKWPKKASREPKPGDKFVIIGNSSPRCYNFFDIGEVVTFVERRANTPNCAYYISAIGLRQSVMDDCVKPYEGK
jgi:hypothetical protein